MFRPLKNIDTAFRQMRLLSLVVVSLSTALSMYVIHTSRREVKAATEKIYILSSGKALEAFASERKENIPVEARDHIKMFHHYFFTLDPDDKVIAENMEKALYLSDASAKEQYNNLKEHGFFASIVAGNISQEIQIDSVAVSLAQYPYYFRCFATQRIIRSTSIVTRHLVTEGYLRNTSRSDNNPHGFLIENWKTLENKDLHVENR